MKGAFLISLDVIKLRSFCVLKYLSRFSLYKDAFMSDLAKIFQKL